ncbi:TlpA family protein disulfide reductase [Aliarcobacter butzleri]|uniref:TlpA family protein disulfide reductase n=1 Tax=Aliarcobacter butzleri TaxID=28197 RepID=UPI0021B4699E|nr:thioredoxin family protein [Aliarcobacter butzleri]MCT7615640.1 thioredoxin family protein [Aliarcobacter butzleri]
MKIFRVLILSVLLCLEMYSSSFNVTDIEKNRINIVAFVTSWCPVCTDVTNFLEKFANQNKDLKITLVFVDEDNQTLMRNENNINVKQITYVESQKFGVDKSVPYILVFDKELKVIKKYNSFNELLLTKLVKNLQQGLYENGTLPPEQRIDLWQKNRF